MAKRQPIGERRRTMSPTDGVPPRTAAMGGGEQDAAAARPSRRAGMAFDLVRAPGQDDALACDPNDPESCR